MAYEKGMKGQFFLVSAFFLVLIFYMGAAVYLQPSHSKSGSEIPDLFDNIRSEYPHAFNLGLNESRPSEILSDFTQLSINVSKSRGADLAALWITTVNQSSDLNVTVGNFLGYDTNVTLNVSGSMKTLQVNTGNVESHLFSSPPSEFQLLANFNTTGINLLLEKYKANLYVILNMRMGEEKIINEEIS
jgi:hypothetical protein